MTSTGFAKIPFPNEATFLDTGDLELNRSFSMCVCLSLTHTLSLQTTVWKRFQSFLCSHPLHETLPCSHVPSVHRAAEDGLPAPEEEKKHLKKSYSGSPHLLAAERRKQTGADWKGQAAACLESLARIAALDGEPWIQREPAGGKAERSLPKLKEVGEATVKDLGGADEDMWGQTDMMGRVS